MYVATCDSRSCHEISCQYCWWYIPLYAVPWYWISRQFCRRRQQLWNGSRTCPLPYQVYYTWYVHKVSTFRFLLGRRDASRWLGWSTDTLNKDRCPARPSRDDRRGCDTTGVVERGDRGVRCMCPSTMCTYYAFDLQQHHTS